MTPFSPPKPIGPASRTILAALAVVWLLAVFGGGSARPDVLYIVPLRFAAVVGIGVLLLAGHPERLSFRDKPLIFLGLVALAIAVQLIPLPHAFWAGLPGRAAYDDLSSVPEIGEIWRPISLAPDLTWNALLSVVPPLFFLVAIPMLAPRYRRWILIGLLATILISAMLGLLQLAGGPESNLRWYHFSNFEAATGFFANRNHEAAFISMGIPLTVWWALSDSRRGKRWPRLAIGTSIIVFLLIAVATSQSRVGLVVAGLSLLLSAVYLIRQLKAMPAWLLIWFGVALPVVGVLTWVALTAWSPERLSVAGAEKDLRIAILPESLEALRTFFPVGAGVGAFPNVFTRFESVQDLSPQYVNHTHTELTQIVIEGGIVSLLLLALFLGWYLIALVRAWRAEGGKTDLPAEARLCAMLVLLPLVASITDYPIRAPLMACTFAAVAALLNQSVLGLRRPGEGQSSI